jgi:STE24 endopeptidase
VLFGVVRRLPRTWWIWGSLVTICFLIFVSLIVPVYIVPIFNKVSRLEDPATTQPILIPVRDVYQVDASRQTTRMSAALESGEPRPLSRGTSSQLVRAG